MATVLSDKAWKNVELKGNAVGRFKEFCRDMHIKFETSEAGYGYIHFEVLIDNNEERMAKEFLETL